MSPRLLARVSRSLFNEVYWLASSQSCSAYGPYFESCSFFFGSKTAS